MRTTISTTALALTLGLGAALLGPVGAAGQADSADADRVPEGAEISREGPAATDGSSTAAQGASDIQAGQLVGKDVVNAGGNEIGNVEELVVDPNDNIYAIVSVGGFLGIGDKTVAVPIDQLQISEENVMLMSQSSEEELRKMPAYEPGNFEPYAE